MASSQPSWKPFQTRSGLNQQLTNLLTCLLTFKLNNLYNRTADKCSILSILSYLTNLSQALISWSPRHTITSKLSFKSSGMLFNVDVEEETSSSRSFFSFASKTFFSSDVFWYLIQTSRNFRLIKKDGEREREEKRNSQIIQHEKLPKMTPKIAQKVAKRMFGISKKGKAIFVHSAACQKFFAFILLSRR